MHFIILFSGYNLFYHQVVIPILIHISLSNGFGSVVKTMATSFGMVKFVLETRSL